MNLAEYIAERGSQTRLAKAIAVSPVLINQWGRGVRPVPINRCAAIEEATGGKVTRAELRPDDYWMIWPELGRPEVFGPAPSADPQHQEAA